MKASTVYCFSILFIVLVGVAKPAQTQNYAIGADVSFLGQAEHGV